MLITSGGGHHCLSSNWSLFSHVHLLRGSPVPICDTWGSHFQFDCFRRTLALPGTIQEALGDDMHTLNRVLFFLKQVTIIKQNFLNVIRPYM